MLFAALSILIPICDGGQLCASCSDMDSLGTCHRYITCENTEQCYQRQYTNATGYPLYELGCISSQVCPNTPVMIGKRAGSHIKCFSCCNQTALCNHGLDCATSATPIRNVCASCNNVSRPSDCHRQETCSKDESCYIYKYRTSSGAFFFDLGCTSDSACPSTSTSTPVSRRKKSDDRHFTCLACCNNADSCNRKLTCDGSIVSPTATSHPSPSTTSAVLPRDCSELQLSNHRNGSYVIYPYGATKVKTYVHCEFDSDGAWTVIQRRFNGSTNFYRNWTEYKRGFGRSDSEYWLGNDRIHQLTSSGNYTLKIRLTDWNDNTTYAKYNVFRVSNETYNYTLTVDEYSGDAGDSLKRHNGMQFSTLDRDRDTNKNSFCVINCGKGAWWHESCCDSSLNAKYSPDLVHFESGMLWLSPYRAIQVMKADVMMIMRK